MTQEEFEKRVERTRVVPVCSFSRPEDALSAARALEEAEFEVIEITLRNDAALAAIEAVADECSAGRLNLAVGAGSVRSEDQIAALRNAGATFAVSPGFSEDLCRALLATNLPQVPGIATPGEAMRAGALGLKTVKVFPASVLGGTKFIRAIAGPLPDFRFMPTGGIKEDNLDDYFAIPAVVACGGSWLTSSDLLEKGEWKAITELARSARARAAAART